MDELANERDVFLVDEGEERLHGGRPQLEVVLREQTCRLLELLQAQVGVVFLSDHVTQVLPALQDYVGVVRT